MHGTLKYEITLWISNRVFEKIKLKKKLSTDLTLKIKFQHILHIIFVILHC